MKFFEWWSSIRCQCFHRNHHRVAVRHREMYLRCVKCGLRTESVDLPKPAYRITQPGNPERYQIYRVLPPKVEIVPIEELKWPILVDETVIERERRIH